MLPKSIQPHKFQRNQTLTENRPHRSQETSRLNAAWAWAGVDAGTKKKSAEPMTVIIVI